MFNTLFLIFLQDFGRDKPGRENIKNRGCLKRTFSLFFMTLTHPPTPSLKVKGRGVFE